MWYGLRIRVWGLGFRVCLGFIEVYRVRDEAARDKGVPRLWSFLWLRVYSNSHKVGNRIKAK